MPPKKLALTEQQIYDKCINTIITSRDLRAMMRDEAYRAIIYRNEQLVFFKIFLKENCYKSANAKLLSIIFDISEGQVRKIITKSKKEKKDVGRPFKISPDNEKKLIEEIKSKKSTQDFMTMCQIIKYAEDSFRISLTYGWLNSFIFRHKDDLKKAVISPQENLRLQVPRRFLTEFLDLVDHIIQITPAELVYNIDETGLSDWEERHTKTVIVPSEIDVENLHYPVDRGNRHITFIVTISGGGDAYFPLAVTSNPELEQIFDLGVRRDVDLFLKISNSPYINKETFVNHIMQNFIPQVQNDRRFCGDNQLPAILFFDNCSCHIDNELLQILAQNMILVISYPSHTSHVFQVLDLLLFGVLKAYKKHIPKNDHIRPKVDHFYRSFKAYELSTCSTTIRSSFSKAGFDYFKKDGKYYLKLNRQKIENSDAFKEIWQINYPEEELSTRRKNQKRGWLNQQYFSEEFQQQILG